MYHVLSACLSAQVWSARAEKRFESRGTSSVHSAAVTSVAVHPTGDYLVSASLDGSWAILDVASGLTCLRQVRLSTAMSKQRLHTMTVCFYFYFYYN